MTTGKVIVAWVIGLIAWLGFVIYAGLGGLWMNAVATPGAADEFFDYSVAALEQYNRGSAALVLVEKGKVVAQHYMSPDDSVGASSVFAVASMSKWVAAYAVLTLVEAGRADLDAPVSQYLTRWQLADSEFDNDAVTIRRLLSHTAGFADGLGFGDYPVNAALPTLEEQLDNPRSSSGAAVKIGVSIQPGSEWHYSGGSYLLLELLVEEISGLSFEGYVKDTVFAPLGMSRSGYKPLDAYANTSGTYDVGGNRVPGRQYASSAATALVLSAEDLSRFVLAQTVQSPTEGPLGAHVIASMRQPHGRRAGADIWGLGTILYAPTGSGDFVYGHDGANDPAINTAARINPDTGDALILLVTGHPTLASDIGAEWVLWQTGYPDVLALNAVLASMMMPAILGALLICAAGLLVYARRGP